MSFIYMLQCYSFKKLKDLTNDNSLGYKSRKTPWTKKTPTRSDLYTIVINYEGFPLATRQ